MSLEAELAAYPDNILQDELHRRRQARIPPRRCSKCGMLEEDTEWGRLFDVTVTVEDGEEGFAQVRMYLCDEHGPDMHESLKSLGFVDHRHGGINFLEAECVSHPYENCPWPSEYGLYVVEYREEI